MEDPFLQRLVVLISSCSVPRSRRSFCRVFSYIPGTVDKSLDCILKNSTDGRENVTLITSEKNRLVRNLNRNLFLPLLAWIHSRAGAVSSLPCCSCAAAGCPADEMPQAWLLHSPKGGRYGTGSWGKDRIEPGSVCFRMNAAGCGMSECISGSCSYWDRFMFLLSQTVLLQFHFF